MIKNKAVFVLCCGLALAILSGCSRQQSDWEKTRTTNTVDAYEQFLKHYPSGEFTAQARARVKELYEEREWQKARDTDTQEAYQAFLKEYPEGKWTEEARIRVENFTLAQAPSNASSAAGEGTAAATDDAGTATAPGVATPGVASPGVAPQGASPHSAAPAPQPRAPRTPAPVSAAATPAAPAFAGHGRYGVQLGAFKSSAHAANRRWEHLHDKYPKLFADVKPKVAPKKTATGTLYRLQVLGITEKRARAICRTLKADSQPCIPVAMRHE